MPSDPVRNLTGCECPAYGWCERHACEKGYVMWQLCRRDRAYFQAWEQGQGFDRQGANSALAADEPCQFRGNAIRQERCRSCRGDVRLHVFACEKHQECTIGTALLDVTCCATCTDFVPRSKGKLKT